MYLYQQKIYFCKQIFIFFLGVSINVTKMYVTDITTRIRIQGKPEYNHFFLEQYNDVFAKIVLFKKCEN